MDRERDLDARGVADASWAGTVLRARGWFPDLALVSDARRTRQTFEHVAAALPRPPRAVITPALYGASADEILEATSAVGDEVGRLLVVGHNPGIGALARQLAGSGETADLGRLAARFPTACLAVIDVPDPWSVPAGNGRLTGLVWPEEPVEG